MERISQIEVFKLVVSILVCQGAGIVGALFTTPAISTWYQTLKKPWFTPPNWAFSPVWITLFVLMGISLYLVWHKGFTLHQVKISFAVFAIQLILNILWSAAFFGLRSPSSGLIVIVILWVFILLTILSFYRVSPVAAYLLIPYIAWVSVAAALNYYVWVLN